MKKAILFLLGSLFALLINTLDRIFWILKCIFYKPLEPDSPTWKIASIKVSDPENENETEVRRHPLAVNGLISTSRENIFVFSEYWNLAAKEFAKKKCQGSRKLIKKEYEEIINEDGTKKLMEISIFGPLEWKTYEQVDEIIKNVGSGIVQLCKLEPQSMLGIFEETREEWIQISHACHQHNIILTTIYTSLGIRGLISVVNECELTTLVCNGSMIDSIKKIEKEIPSLKYIIYLDNYDQPENDESKIVCYSFQDIYNYGKQSKINPKRKPTPDDVCVIMYTSGSTGEPKGCVLTNFNLTSIVSGSALHVKYAKTDNDIYLGYLPLAHIMEFQVENFLLTIFGAAIGYGSPRTLTDKWAKPFGDLKAIQPDFMSAVPKVFDTIRKGILEMIDKKGKFAKWLFNTGFKYKNARRKQRCDTPLWNLILFNRFKQEMGGRMRAILCGGAATSIDCYEFITTVFGVQLLQGYGLTEVSGGFALQDYYTVDGGKCGGPLLCCELKLVDCPELGYRVTDKPYPRGEIVGRGYNIFKGYYKKPELTKQVIKEGGWFYTGDIGCWNPDGTISIIDRKKHLIKLAHGEYVALTYLESIYLSSPFVAPNSLWIYGDCHHSYLVAIVLPQESYLMKWAKLHNISGDLNQVCKNPKVIEAVLNSFKRIAIKNDLKNFEMIKKVTIVNDVWEPKNGLVTAALKLKRNNLYKKYKDEIHKMYQENS